MFTITEQAKQYIHAHGGHVIITLTFEPSLEGVVEKAI